MLNSWLQCWRQGKGQHAKGSAPNDVNSPLSCPPRGWPGYWPLQLLSTKRPHQCHQPWTTRRHCLFYDIKLQLHIRPTGTANPNGLPERKRVHTRHFSHAGEETDLCFLRNLSPNGWKCLVESHCQFSGGRGAVPLGCELRFHSSHQKFKSYFPFLEKNGDLE